MPDWLLAAIIAGCPGLIAAGGAFARLRTVEKSLEKCVSRELFDATYQGFGDKLDKIETTLEKLYDRLLPPRTEESGGFLRR